MTTYVLLHGGGMGGWVWKFVAPLLRKKGHDVYTPTFTGFGERVHLIGRNVTNETHVTDIVNILRYEDISDCILAGHSYGGSVLSGIDAQEGARVRRYVSLDGIVPKAGESVVEAMGYMPPEQAKAMAAALARGEGPVGSDVHLQQRAMAKEHPNEMDPAREQWLLDHLSDMPLSCTVNPIPIGADSIKKPIDYVAAARTVMTPMHGRARALGWKIHELDGDHAFIVGQPEWTANLLLSMA